MLGNTATRFGIVSIFLHWAMALLVIALLVLGTRLSTLQPGLANLWLYGLHKTMGLLALVLVAVRLIWHRISPPPPPLGPPNGWEVRAAKAAHRLIYVLLIFIPLSGWVRASASGLDILVAETWVIPPIAPVSVRWEDAAALVHAVLTKVLLAVLLLHILGAARRAMLGDGTLSRMLGR